MAVLQKTYASTQNLIPLAISDQRSKIVILDNFQLLLLKHCLYKFCQQSNTIYTFLYLRTAKIDLSSSVVFSNVGLVSKCYFVLIFVCYNLFRSWLRVSLLHIFRFFLIGSLSDMFLNIYWTFVRLAIEYIFGRAWFRFIYGITNFTTLFLTLNFSYFEK